MTVVHPTSAGKTRMEVPDVVPMSYPSYTPGYGNSYAGGIYLY